MSTESQFGSRLASVDTGWCAFEFSPREIVRRASQRAKNAQVRDWLWKDERGSWEKVAREMIETTADRRRQCGMSDVAARDEMADRLVLLALQAKLASGRGTS